MRRQYPSNPQLGRVKERPQLAMFVVPRHVCVSVFSLGSKGGEKDFFPPNQPNTAAQKHRNVYNIVLQKSILNFFKALSLIKSRQRITFSPILLHLTWTHTGGV